MINPDFDFSDNPLSQGEGHILRSEIERWAEATTKPQDGHEVRFPEKVEAVIWHSRSLNE